MSNTERLGFINSWIKERGSIRLKDITERFEISARQAKRDIEYLRDRMDAPIVYDADLKAYKYGTPFDNMDFADEKALLFYTFIEKISQNRHYLPFVSRETLARILNHIPQDYRRLFPHFSYEMDETEDFDLNVFQAVIRSLLKKQRLVFDYDDASGKHSRRTVEPRHLICYQGHWYVVAFDHDRMDLRKFLLARIKNAVMTGGAFGGRVSDKELTEYLSGSFGIFKKSRTEKVTVRFYEPIYHVVAGQSFHKSEKRTEGLDPIRGRYLEIVVPVSDYRELIGKLLRYGAAAEAVSPTAFRDEWLSQIREMAERYLS